MTENNQMDEAVVIALGSSLKANFPTRQALMEAAIDRFAPAGLRVLDRSGWWNSAAWPDATEPDYLNAVTLVETPHQPHKLLQILMNIERAMGRERTQRNAPRTLDLDLIAYGRTVSDEPALQLPHPRAHERLFVMGPLAEIAPDWVHPTLGRTARDLARSATVGVDAVPA